MSPDPFWRRPLPPFIWLVAILVLMVWIAAQMGLFALSEPVETVSGAQWLPNTFASVDHPFHVARAETLLQALRDGEPLRWIDHQGGYPVEFYPLGVAWLEVGVWGLSLGHLSISQTHTVVIILIFLLPGLAYGLMAATDGRSLRVALIALALHVVVPGDWWHGGYTELVQWGLVTNVAGAVAALFFLAWLTRFVEANRGLAGGAAVLAAATAMYANPRSLIALAIIGAGVWIAAVAVPLPARRSVFDASVRIAIVAILTMMVAAPEILSFVRFDDLYQFVHYEWYASAREYLQSSIAAVSLPVFLLAIGGGVAAFRRPPHTATRAVAATLLLYVAATLWITGPGGELFAQLESTRLMPFQRLLTIYLAAIMIETMLRWLGEVQWPSLALLPDAIAVGLVIVLLLGRVTPSGAEPPVPGDAAPPDRALFAVVRAAVPEQSDLQDAIETASAVAAPGTALLVIGSALSWHQQLWAPLWTDRPLFYDNWLWFWHEFHAGTPGYFFANGHHYPDPGLALDRAYLDHHGIGAVVATGPVAELAMTAPWLDEVRSGTYDVFVVRDPTEIVTFDGAKATSIDLGAQRLTAAGSSQGGHATIRRNWYPRWRAVVNGAPAPITRTSDGYMAVEVPQGEVTLQLVYATDTIDWLGRGLCGAGLLGSGALALRGLTRPRTPSARSTWRTH